METKSSLFHSEASPELKCSVVEKEVKMLLLKLVEYLLGRKNRFGFEGLSTNILNFILREVQSL